MVEVTICRSLKLKRTGADIVQSLIVDTESLIRVLNELVDRKGGIVWLERMDEWTALGKPQ